MAEGKLKHVVGLLALQQSMLEEVAAGGDWGLSWSILPFADPTDPSPLASMSVQQYATGVAYLKDPSLVQDRRNKTGGGETRDKRPAAKGKWTQLSKAQQEALEEWKKKNSGK